MNWRNIRLIYAREIRDQLRDRRTLFMIAVLPLLLYPLLGMSVFQLSQFLRKSEPKVVVVGSRAAESGQGTAAAVSKATISRPSLFGDAESADWLHLEFVEGLRSEVKPDKHEDQPQAESRPKTGDNLASALESAEASTEAGDVQVVLTFPPDFGKRLHELRAQIKAHASGATRQASGEAGRSHRNSRAANSCTTPARRNRASLTCRSSSVLDSWKSQIVRENLLASRVPANVAKPFELEPHDVAERSQQQALIWSKILPFVLFIWALTGAFYPAVDLCAAKKSAARSKRCFPARPRESKSSGASC